jgi:hypothetical protein
VTVELNGGETARLRASCDHPYAAIDRAVERLQLNSRPVPPASPHHEIVAVNEAPTPPIATGSSSQPITRHNAR